MVTSAGNEGSFPLEDNPLELSMGNEAFFLADAEPMGVVAEVIRNDMGGSLGIVVYDDTTKQVHKFRANQLVVRSDGNVTVLPSWFRKSREILKNIEPMEQAVPAIRKARRKGLRLSDVDAARATSEAPVEVQRFVDEGVILRSQLIGKLHGLFEKQRAAEAQLRDATSPGVFDRTPDADRVLIIATLRRSLRLNNQTIAAMRDFLVRMDASYLFPKDPRYRSLFKAEEFPAVDQAAPSVPDEGVEEFETFEDAEEFEAFEDAEEFEAFEETGVMEEFSSVEEPGHLVPAAAPAGTGDELPPPPPPSPAAAAAAPSYDDVEALPDEDDMTVHQPSLMTVGAPGWIPPQPGGAMAPAPPPTTPATGMPPPPPGAVLPPPPVPMPPMDALEASAQRKIEGRPAAPEPVAKKAGLLGRLRRGRERQERAPAGAVAAGAAAGGAVAMAAGQEPEEFETFQEMPQMEEFAPVQEAPPPPAKHPLPPPPTIPPPPSYTPHGDTFQSVDEFETFKEMPPTEEFAPVPDGTPPAPRPQAPPQLAPPPAPMPAPQPARAPAPVPTPATAPEEEFETFEEEVVEEFSEEMEAEDRPLDAEKDIDAILAMALGKAPAPKGSRPTAKPGVREEIGSPMQSLMSKTKYRRP